LDLDIQKNDYKKAIENGKNEEKLKSQAIVN
jgi:hypothetical protein